MTNIIRESVNGISLVNINDELFDKRMIFFTDTFTSESCNELIKKLLHLEQTDNSSEITIFINSPGGEIVSGLAVYDIIRMMKSPVRTVCTGCAASMGSIIFLAGDKREMLPNTKVMIHDPSFGGGSFAGLKPMDLKERLDKLNDDKEKLVGIISERTGIPLDEIKKMTEKDTYFTAEEAVEKGIATSIITDLGSLC